VEPLTVALVTVTAVFAGVVVPGAALKTLKLLGRGAGEPSGVPMVIVRVSPVMFNDDDDHMGDAADAAFGTVNATKLAANITKAVNACVNLCLLRFASHAFERVHGSLPRSFEAGISDFWRVKIPPHKVALQRARCNT
jgi:hypothetical protein